MSDHVQLFDVWSLAALAFWVLLGGLSWRARDRVALSTAISASALATFVWETVDYFAARTWELWPTETWVNSWISDPLMAMAGVTLAWWALTAATHRRAPAT